MTDSLCDLEEIISLSDELLDLVLTLRFTKGLHCFDMIPHFLEFESDCFSRGFPTNIWYGFPVSPF